MALGQKVLTTAKALSDATRFAIYQYLHNHTGKGVTVDKLARHFDLHPNAVRLHMGKLEQAGLAMSAAAKSAPGGGRPRREYRAGLQPVEIMLPYRNFRLLAQLLAGLAKETGLSAGQIEGFGESWGKSLAAALPDGPYTQSELLDIILRQLKRWGLGSIAGPQGEEPSVLVINSCVFKEVAEDFPGIICTLVHSVLTGMVGALAPRQECLVENGISRGESSCRVLIQKK